MGANKVKTTELQFTMEGVGGKGICPLLHEVRKQKLASKFKRCKRAN